MLLTRQKREPVRGQLNMAAMIDVVFLLLIFFMCTSSFTGLENDLLTQLPRASAALAAQPDDRGPIRVRVSRGEAGIRVTCDDQFCATLDDLRERLQARREIDKDYPVIIEGQAAVPFRYMVAALDTCYRADLRRVAFSTKGVGR